MIPRLQGVAREKEATWLGSKWDQHPQKTEPERPSLLSPIPSCSRAHPGRRPVPNTTGNSRFEKGCLVAPHSWPWIHLSWENQGWSLSHYVLINILHHHKMNKIRSDVRICQARLKPSTDFSIKGELWSEAAWVQIPALDSFTSGKSPNICLLVCFALRKKISYTVILVSTGHVFQDPTWIPKSEYQVHDMLIQNGIFLHTSCTYPVHFK